jgi:hypothetical protein
VSRTVRGGPNAPHVRIPKAVLNSPAYIALDASARSLYVDLRLTLGPTNNGNIDATMTKLRHRGWRSSATLWRAVHQLEAVGLIAKTRQGGIAYMSKVCSLYRFTDEAVFDLPKQRVSAQKATNEFIEIKSLADARTAIAQAACKTPRTSKVQKLKLQLSETEAMKYQKLNKSAA